MRARLARYRHYWTATGVIPRWQLVAVYALVLTVVLIGYLRVGNVADDAHSAANQAKVAAHDAQAAAHNAQRAVAGVQRQRKDLCKDQNGRRKATIDRLDELIAKLPPDQKAQAKSIRASNVSLINALAPKRNCAAITNNP